MKRYKLITVNHKLLNTEDLQHFIIRHEDKADLRRQLEELKDAFGQEEVLYLATCNRVMYLFYGEQEIADGQKLAFFHQINDEHNLAQWTNISQIIQSFAGEEAIQHLFEVASSIDSLVVGEREIFRQFREAYDWCWDQKLAGDKIRLLVQATVRAAKDVYTNTGIGTKPVSVVSLAIQSFLKRQLPTEAKILLIGAGETNSTAGRFLIKHGYTNLIIFNRSLDNAQKLSDELGAEARYLGSLTSYDEGFDAIFACTASQDPIITSDLMAQISDGAPKVMIDLSIPHNIADEVAQSEAVDYISIDSIRELANENMSFRNGNIAAARMILSGHLETFQKTFTQRQVEVAFGQLPGAIHEVKDRALNIVYKDKIAEMSPEAQDLIKEIANYMEKKCVAAPMKIVRKEIVTQ